MYGNIVIFGWKPAKKSEKVSYQLPHPWGTPCTTQKVKQATFVFVSSTNHHLGWSYLSGYSLEMAACMPMGISDPESPAPRLQLFLCPLPLKVWASCGGGHSKWAYISYWDLDRIQPKFELSSIKSNTGIQAGILWQQITLLEIVVP